MVDIFTIFTLSWSTTLAGAKSRASLLADHLRLAVGCEPMESPQEVALGYMNNVAYAHGMQAVFRHSYYVGTFGEYDMGAVRNAL